MSTLEYTVCDHFLKKYHGVNASTYGSILAKTNMRSEKHERFSTLICECCKQPSIRHIAFDESDFPKLCYKCLDGELLDEYIKISYILTDGEVPSLFRPKKRRIISYGSVIDNIEDLHDSHRFPSKLFRKEYDYFNSLTIAFKLPAIYNKCYGINASDVIPKNHTYDIKVEDCYIRKFNFHLQMPFHYMKSNEYVYSTLSGINEIFAFVTNISIPQRKKMHFTKRRSNVLLKVNDIYTHTYMFEGMMKFIVGVE